MKTKYHYLPTKCKDCVHRNKTRCIKRSMEINIKFIRAWGCDDYKPNYESLLKGE